MAKITDPWGNRSLLINGSSGVLKYSSWLNWQSWSPSAVGLGWCRGACQASSVCVALAEWAFRAGREGGRTLPLGLPIVSTCVSTCASFLRANNYCGDFSVAGGSVGWLQLKWDSARGRGKQMALSLQKDGEVSRSGLLPKVTLRNSVSVPAYFRGSSQASSGAEKRLQWSQEGERGSLHPIWVGWEAVGWKFTSSLGTGKNKNTFVKKAARYGLVCRKYVVPAEGESLESCKCLLPKSFCSTCLPDSLWAVVWLWPLWSHWSCPGVTLAMESSPNISA